MKVLLASLAFLSHMAAAEFLQRDDNTTVITRVVNLLTALKGTIEEDGKAEQEAYDKLACWCTQSTGRSANTINEVKAELGSLGTHILELRGKVATLEGEISNLIQEIKSNENTQAELTSARQKENAAYMAEKAEQTQALTAIEKALIVLTGATTSYLQTSAWNAAFSTALAATTRASSHAQLNTRQLSALAELTRHQASGSYAPQSATIQGILQDMYSTFSADLESDTTAEANAMKGYEELMDVKQQALKALQDNLVKKESQKAEAELMLADGSQSYEDNEEKLKAETTLYDTTKASCANKTQEWSVRSSLRTEELQGINQALALLTTDEARDLFTKAIKPGFASPSFLQTDSSILDPAKQAFEALQAQARNANSPRLAALAAKLVLGRGGLGKAGHFDTVIKAIDTLVATIESQKEADTKQVDLCKTKYFEIEKTSNDLQWQIEKNTAKIDKIQKDIDDKTDAKDLAITSIADLQKELTELETKRNESHAEFLAAKSDDEKAISLLEDATTALTAYYSKYQNLLQRNSSDPGPEPEFKLSDKTSRKNPASGIVKLLTMVTQDLKNEVQVAIQAEEAAQADYEAMVKARKDAINKLDGEKTNLETSIVQQGKAKETEEGLKTSNDGELSNEEQTLTDIKPDCDLFISGQAERRRKMAAELEGLRDAKEYLLGAMPSVPIGMVQKPSYPPQETKSVRQITKHGVHGFDDSAFPRITFQAVSFLQSRRGTSTQ